MEYTSCVYSLVAFLLLVALVLFAAGVIRESGGDP